MDRMQIETRCGSVQGVQEENLWVFRGVPYARAGRFEAPREYAWEGVLAADHFGKKAMQSWKRTAPWMLEQEREEFSEDCLNLNIYVPAGKGETEKLPVAVYLHGGAFQNGSNQTRDGRRVIGNHRFIYVSVNYRLGVLGYLYLGNALGEDWKHTGNLGTMDQLAALKWVHENISAFGGDPQRVTVFGESAGAKSLGALLLRPEMKEYCSQVLMASGAWQCIRDTKTADTVANAFFEEAYAQGVLEKKEDILTMDVDKLIAVQERIVDNPGNTCMFGPVADGKTIPFDWPERIRRGEYWSGKAVVGSCLHEMVFYKTAPDFVEKAPLTAGALFGENARIAVEEYGEWERSCLPGEAKTREEKADKWVQLLSDYMYRTYSHRLARTLTENGSQVWYYSFEYGLSAHVQDQSMAFEDGAANDFFFPGVSRREREDMAEILHESYVRFFETGNPGWEKISDWKSLGEGGCVMVWGKEPYTRPFREDEVLDRFPDSVYKKRS